MGFGTAWMRGRAALAAAVLLGGLQLGAAPASAGNFERAFEYELGRLMAHEVVGLGHFLLGGYARPVGPPVAVPVPVPVYARPAYRVRRPPVVHYGPPHPAPCAHERVVYERYERTLTPAYGPIYGPGYYQRTGY